MENSREKIEKEIAALELKIEELKRKMPAHSVSVEMMQKLEDMEDELDNKKRN